MKNIINRITTPFFIGSFIVGIITIVYFINKSPNAVYFNASSNVVDIVGECNFRMKSELFD